MAERENGQDEFKGQAISGPYLQRIADKLSDMVLCVDARGELTYVSSSIDNILGYSSEVFQRLYNLAMTFSSDKRFRGAQEFVDRHLKHARKQLLNGEILDPEVLQMTHRDGFRIYLEVVCIPFTNATQEFAGVTCICRKCDKSHRQNEAMALAAKVFDSSLAGIYITDPQGVIIRVNKAFSRLTGFGAEEVMGVTPQCLEVEPSNDNLLLNVGNETDFKKQWEGETQLRRKNGDTFPANMTRTLLCDPSGNVRNTVTHFSDITEQKSCEEKIHRLAYFDPLTGLPNRSLFIDRLGETIKRAKRNKTAMVLMFLDLDHFKNINDTLGHHLGDALLNEVGQRLCQCVREEDTVARMGGDEFTVILGDLSCCKEATTTALHVANKVKAVIEQPFSIDKRTVFSGSSIGIALYPADAASPKALIQNADTAMYHAKALGKNNYQFYTEAMNQKAKKRSELERALYQALEKHEFELNYQAIFNAEGSKLVGLEALVRWRHPQRGLLMPKEFIAIAEEAGLITALGNWVLLQACTQWLEWHERGFKPPRLALNVSARQFRDGSIVDTLRTILLNTKMRAEFIEIEITESALMEDNLYARKILEEIHHLGVSISIDDFGTGYSSLSYIKNFHIDNLKIDRSFMEGLPANEDQQIIRAIVSLAKSLDLKVIAEGVETPLQLAFIQKLGCNEVQGYLLGNPVPASQMFVQ